MATSFPEPPLAFRLRVAAELAQAESRIAVILREAGMQVVEPTNGNGTVELTGDAYVDAAVRSGLFCKGECGAPVRSHKGIAGWCVVNGCRTKEIARRIAEGTWKGRVKGQSKKEEPKQVAKDKETADYDKLASDYTNARMRLEEVKKIHAQAKIQVDEARAALMKYLEQDQLEASRQ